MTTNTLIPHHPARIWFLAPIAKYLDEIKQNTTSWPEFFWVEQSDPGIPDSAGAPCSSLILMLLNEMVNKAMLIQ